MVAGDQKIGSQLNQTNNLSYLFLSLTSLVLDNNRIGHDPVSSVS